MILPRTSEKIRVMIRTCRNLSAAAVGLGAASRRLKVEVRVTAAIRVPFQRKVLDESYRGFASVFGMGTGVSPGLWPLSPLMVP